MSDPVFGYLLLCGAVVAIKLSELVWILWKAYGHDVGNILRGIGRWVGRVRLGGRGIS